MNFNTSGKISHTTGKTGNRYGIYKDADGVWVLAVYADRRKAAEVTSHATKRAAMQAADAVERAARIRNGENAESVVAEWIAAQGVTA
jgi:hypothetical protein